MNLFKKLFYLVIFIILKINQKYSNWNTKIFFQI